MIKPSNPVAYVPGFDHDIFISYCHGDDRPWIRSFYELLKPRLKEQLGVEPLIWIDEKDLERSDDFRSAIPEQVLKSALYLFLPSNQYVRSPYCVNTECPAFATTIPEKRARFAAEAFKNKLFAFRAAILPVDNNEHWKLLTGATDYTFHDGHFRLPISSDDFRFEFNRLVLDIADLLKRMRNYCTKVFLYPRDPGPSVAQAHIIIKTELLDNCYSVLPDSLVDLETPLLESALAVFLLDESYDPRMLPLIETVAKRGQLPWAAWESPAAHATAVQDQQVLVAQVELSRNLDSPGRRFFSSTIRPDQLKRELLDLLKPSTQLVFAPSHKRRVALVYDSLKREELASAGDIRSCWNSEFDFALPTAGMPPPATSSDAVLLIWGKAEQDWAADQFQRLRGVPGRKGLCILDPQKGDVVQQLRDAAHETWDISEHYGPFVPATLEGFFAPLRQSQSVGGH